MAITQCQINREQREGTIQTRATRQYNETYLIRTDNEFWGPSKTALEAQALTRSATVAPLPKLYDTYTEYDGVTPLLVDPGIYCMEIRIRQADSVYNWTANAIYRRLGNGEDDSEVTDPANIPTKYWIEFADTYNQVTWARNVEPLGGLDTGSAERPADTWGPIVNGALQSLDEDLQGNSRRVFFVAEVSMPDLPSILDYHRTWDGTENNANFYGYPAGHAQYAGANSSRELELNGIKYYLMTVRIEVSKTRFEYKVDNVGYKYYTASFPLVLAEHPGPEPVHMFYTGQIRNPDDSNTYQITYRDKTPADYSLIGF